MATSNAATTFLEHRILNFIFKNNAQVGGANFGTGNGNGLGDNIWVGLATAVSDAETGSTSDLTETTFTNYTRKQITASNWTLDSATENEQQAKNSANIEWSASGTDANVTITHVFIASASTSGNIYFVGALDTPKTLALGDIFRINAENLIVEMK
tara:strand:- start:1620 stop:2087 length:468 start_codon:yes stop_codon:yes gene_type:complete